jgi:2-methylcitrate dehydratase
MTLGIDDQEESVARESLALQMAEQIVASKPDDLDAATTAYTKDLVLSCLGAMIGGSVLPVGRALTRYVTAQGARAAATMVGDQLRTSADLAALANAVFAHATEYEDDSFPEAVTPFTVLPPLLAVAEEHHLGGKELLHAIVIAHEVQSRLGRACVPALDRGFQLLPIVGTIGTAAGVARLLELPVDGVATALSIAASHASGLRIQYRSMTHYLESGHAARSGLLAACLAREGVDAALDVFEGMANRRFSFLTMLGCPENEDLNITQEWGTPFRVHDVGIKRYPACFLLQPAVRSLIDMKRDHGVSLSDVVDVSVHGNDSLVKCDIAEPTSYAEALQSLQHVAAASLCYDDLTVDKFTEAAIADRALTELRSLVRFVERTDWPDGVLAAPVQVSVTLSSGEVLESTTVGVDGLPPNPHLTTDDVIAKFGDAVGDVLDRGEKTRIIECVAELDELTDCSSLASLFGGRSR